MEGLQALTSFYGREFDTLGLEKYDTKSKNEKVVSLINTKRRQRATSSENRKWEEIESFENTGMIHYVLGTWKEPTTHLWKGHTDNLLEFVSIIDPREIIETYKKENISINLDINNLYVTEYKPHDSIKLLYEIAEIGKEIFKAARPSNKLEDEAVNKYFRSKTRSIRYKEL